MSSNASNSSLALTPLGAGDLIDRTVRFYRSNFWTFVWIAAPPILLSTILSVGWTMLLRQLINPGAGSGTQEELLSLLLNWFGTLLIFFFQAIVMLTVMGGASRNFVRHLLFGEPITFRETYTNVRSRLLDLLAASFLMVLILGIAGIIIFYIGLMVAVVAGTLASIMLGSIPPLAVVVVIVLGAAILFATGWLFFLLASRFAYIPQIMLVEGQGVFAAMGRSTALAGGNVTRIYALFIFTFVAAYSALLLFYIPLGWYAYVNGIQFFMVDPDAIPAWYVITSQIVWQASFILLTPVLMIGLCLLYVDERVRHEGYDIELMAARNLGEIPALPARYANPLQPALAAETLLNAPPQSSSSKSSITTLGLK
jgi:hypothetical protein